MATDALHGVFTDIYTDGACSGNPGPGGWAWVIPDGPHESGTENPTTNQRMEVKAVLAAIEANDQPIHIFSDSTYVVNCFKDRWYEGWLKRGWKNSQRKAVANRDLWEPLIELAVPRLAEGTLAFTWVKGHAGNPMNELADQLAVAAKDELMGLDGAGGVDFEPDDGAAELPWPIGPALLVIGSTNPTSEQVDAVKAAVASLGPDAVLVTGLRRGIELVAAETALEHRIPVAAVLPFADPAAKWDDDLRSRFDEVYGRASFDIVLSGDPSAPGTAMKERNRWLQRSALGAIVVGDDDLVAQLNAAGLTVVAH